MPKKTSSRQPAPNITSITYWRKFAVHRVFYLFIAGLFGVSAIAYFGSPGGRGGGNSAAERGAVAIAIVNGEPITRAVYDSQWSRQRQQMQQMRRFGGPPPTPMTEVQEQGRLIDQLVMNAVATSLAKKRGITVTDADIERQIEEYKKSGPDGKPMSDAKFEEMLQQEGASMDQLRSDLREGLFPKLLRENIANKEKVTEEDLLKTYDEIKVRRILFPVGTPTTASGAKPDAQAKRDAEDVLAKLKNGADFAKTADQFTKDTANQQTDLDPKTKKPVTTKHGGLLNSFNQGWYKRGGGQPKEFEEAAFKLAKGQMSDVVKTPEGYQILKVEDTRRKLPDNYAKEKAQLIEAEKMNRASQPIRELIEAERKSAKIQWNDPGLEWRYEYSRQAMSPMAGPGDKQQDAFLAKLKAYAEKNKDDGAANLILGQTLDRKLMMSAVKPTASQTGEKEKLRNEAIAAYEQALKVTEDQQTRFRLSSLYTEAGRKPDAVKQYDKIMRLLSYDEDPNSRFAYQQLAMGYKGLQEKEKEAAALKVFAELNKKAEDERKKTEAAQKAAAVKAAAEKAAADKAAAEKTASEKAKSGGTSSAPGGKVNVTPPGPAATGTSSVPPPAPKNNP